MKQRMKMSLYAVTGLIWSAWWAGHSPGQLLWWLDTALFASSVILAAMQSDR